MKNLMNKLSLSLIRAKLGMSSALKDERGDTNFISIAIVLVIVIIMAIAIYTIWTGTIQPWLNDNVEDLTSTIGN